MQASDLLQTDTTLVSREDLLEMVDALVQARLAVAPYRAPDRATTAQLRRETGKSLSFIYSHKSKLGATKTETGSLVWDMPTARRFLGLEPEKREPVIETHGKPRGKKGRPARATVTHTAKGAKLVEVPDFDF